MITKLPTTASAQTTKNFTLSCTPKFLQTTLLSALFFLLLGVGESWGQTQTNTYSTAGTYQWVCPPGVTSITVQAWGAGGAGGGVNTTGVNRAGGGGGGGAFATNTVTVVPGSSYTIVVGAGGTGVSGATGNNGAASSFNSNSVIAAGGNGGVGHTGASSTVINGGLGGAAASCTPSSGAYSGGLGGASATTPTSGGGGGGAGSTAAGAAASGATAGAGGSIGGGAGAAGLTTGNAVGVAGSSPGGGGSGARAASTNTTARAGGAGGAGKVVISYSGYCNPYCTATSAPTTYFTNCQITGGITSLNQTSTSVVSGYSNYYPSVSASAYPNTSLGYSVTMTGGTAGIAIWVDWNNNGVFTDAGETIYNSAAYMNNGTYTGSFTVPSAQSAGNYVVRIRTDFNATSPSSCATASAAETEDYKLTVVALPACVVPSSLAATVTSASQSNTTIAGSFTAATTAPSGYVVVRTATNTQPTLTNGTTYTVGASGSNYIEYVGASAGSWTSTGLTAGTTYYYWVFSYNNSSCSGGPAYSTTASTLTQATSSCTGAVLAGLSYTSAAPMYCSGVAITQNTATLSTTSGTITYSVSPALPTGLTLNTSTGNITGTPSATSAATAYTVTANNGCTTTTASVTITVVTPLSGLTYTSATPAAYCVGTAISSNVVTTTTGGGTITYSVSPALPSGLTLNTATGEISGTPTVSAASATYTVTATNGSCSTTKALTIIVNNNLTSSVLTYSTQSASYCRNAAITTNTASLSPSTNNGTVTYAVLPALPAGLSLSTSTGAITGTPTAAQSATNYTITATSSSSCGSTTSVVSITINAPTTVTPPAAATICSGGTGVSLTASGISSYTWSPTTGLTGTGATVTANPTTTTTYTISGTDANGCSATSSTVLVTVNASPTAITIAQTPASVCSGSVATLTASGGVAPYNASSYSFAASTGQSLNSVTSSTQIVASAQDYTSSSVTNIGFSFIFCGTSYSQFSTSSNGVMGLGSTAVTSADANTLTASSTYPIIAPGWDDMHTCTNGKVHYILSGTSPNRKLVVEWLYGNYSERNSTYTKTVQVVLYETTNIIEFIYGTGSSAFATASIGLSNSSTYYLSVASSTNTASSSTLSESLTTWPSSGTKYTFTPPSAILSWSPTTNLYTNVEATTAYTGGSATTVYALNTEATQYTATATNGSCSSTNSITTSIIPLPTITLGTATAVCAGGTSSSLVYTTTTGSPNQYIIDFDATANAAGFSDITTYTAFSSSPIALVIPAAAGAGTYNGTITVKNSTTGCISTGYAFTVTINAPVSITTQPNNAVSLEGSDATFSVVATGTGLTYQWQVSTDSGSTWNNATGTSTNSSYTAYSISSSMVGYQYKCIVSGTAPCGSVTSSVATLTISSTAIISQPASATICSSGSNTFTIATSGTTPTYQWQVSSNSGTSWSDISGETGASLTVSGLSASNSGNQYRCVLSGSINSDPATLTVYNVVAISTQPVSQTVCSNAASAQFSVAATGSNLTYQWQVSTNGGSSWSNASGISTSATYTISTITNALNLNQYRVIVSGSSPCSAVTSDAVTLNVTGVSLATSSASVCLNGSVTFTATPTSGSPTMTFSLICATSGSGATTANTSNPATITPTAAGSYTYTLTTTGGGCTLTSTQAVTVNANPSITSATASPASVCAGNPVSLSAASIQSSAGTVTLGTGTSTTSSAGITPYSSYYEGSRMQYLITANELSALGLVAGNITSLTFNVSTAGSYTMQGYTIKIGHTNTSSLSNYATLNGTFTTVYGPLAKSSPAVGNDLMTFSNPFAWDGVSNIVIDICHDNDPTATCSGCYGTSVTVSYTTTSFNSVYGAYADNTVMCGNANGTVISTFTNRPNMIFGGQLGTNQTANFNWSWNTSSAVTSATGSTTASNATNSPISQTYSVTATNASTGCSSSSTTSAITINPTPATPTANSTTICGAQNATCSVTGSGVVGNTFKWYTVSSGGTAISEQTGASLSAYPVSTNTTFYVSEANATCESARVAVTQTVTTPPLVSASASVATTCAGQSTTLTASSSNSGYSYSWSNSAGSGSSVSVSPSATTTYTVTATDASGGVSNGCSTSGTVSVTVNPLPTSVTATSSSGIICNGNSVSLTSSSISNSPNTTIANEGFESGLPSGWTVIQNGSGNLWATTTGTTYGTAYQGTGMLQYLWNSTTAANTYAITNGYNLVAGKTYSIYFYELTGAFNERLKLTVGNSQTALAQSTIIADYPAHQVTTWTLRTNTFTPSTSGLYYFGLYAYSASNKYYINIDNFSITTTTDPTFSWTSSPVGFTSSAQNPTGVAPTETTSYTVTATNSYGCSATASTTVSVNQPSVAPTSIAGTTTICAGSSTTLIAIGGTLGTGANYEWGTGASVGSNIIAGQTAATLTVTPTSSTTYWVRITNGTAPCTVTTAGVTATVTVNALQTISLSSASETAAQTVCSGTSISAITYAIGGSATGASVSGLPTGMSGAYASGVFTISGSSSSAGTYTYTVTTTATNFCTASLSGTITVNAPALDWFNIQYPTTAQTICAGSSITAYGQVYKGGVTNGSGETAGLTAEIGWSTSNTDPSTWTNWSAATFNTQSGNNDEFVATFGSSLSSGTYYYAFRYSYNSCYQYGAYNGAWNGTTNTNGVLIINAQPTAAAAGSTQTICEGTTATMAANNPSAGTGAWSIISGPNTNTAQLSSTGSNAAVFTPTAAGTYTLRWTISNGVCTSSTSDVQIIVTSGILDYVNLQWAPTATICQGSTFNAYGQVYESGITSNSGADSAIQVQFGYNSDNTNPSSWTNWTDASYNGQTGNNDEYKITTGSALVAGTYYYTFRYKLNGCSWQYGGYSATGGGTWGGSNVSGVLTINTLPNMPTASNVTLCGTGLVTLTANNPGTGLSVNWYNAAQNTQLAASSLTYTTPNLSTTTSYYAETVNVGTGCVSTNRLEVQAIVNVTNTFTDTTNDHSWFTAGNWSCGTIPTATTNVVIPTAKTVSVYYDINGAPAYANTIVLEGTAAVTVTTDHSMNVTNKVTVASGANFTVQNNASLLQTDNVANEGNITVVKTTPSARLLKRYDAVLWSSPVVQNLRAISTGTPDAYFMQHNPQANSWSAVSSPATADFTKGKGFLVRTPSTFPTTPTQQWSVNFTGVPNNGDVTLSAGDTGNTEKYLLVGNPYPSAISIASFKAGNPNITGVFYFYRKPNGVTSISGYGTLAANGQFSTNDADNLVGALTPGDVIPSGQGFFVAMKSDNNNGNVYFTNAMRVANDHGHFNRVNTNLDSYKLIVKTPVGGNSQLIMNYDSETTNGYDVGYDAVAFTDGTTDLSSIMNNEKYRIQSKGDYNIADVIPVQFKTGVAGEHRIKLQDAQGVFAADQMVIIKDNLTGVQHNLTANGDYVFTSATGTFTNRFEVIYQQAYYTALQANSCGATIANMSSLVYADIVNGATGYRFKVVNNTTSAVQTIDRPQHWFAFNMLSAYDYNTPYTISVQVQKDGVWTGYYGATCTVNSPNIATTGVMQINPSQCGMTLPTLGTVIATTPVAGATGYKFRITNTTAGAIGNNLVQEITRTNHWFSLGMLSRYNYGSSYAIEVAVKTTGGYTPYGNACTVYAPAVPTLATCGQTVTTATTLVRTTAMNLATQYRFQVTRMSTQETITFDTANYWFSFRVNVPGYAAGEQYGVRVAVMTAGAWSPYGDACDITAPIATARTTEEAAPSEAGLFKPVAYPNPFASEFTIALATPFQDDVTIVVYDLQGRLIEKQTVPVTLIDTIHIGANYQMGDYMLVVSQGPAIESMLLHKE